MQAALQGPVERQVKAMTRIIYCVSRERFGTIERKQIKPSVQPNRRHVLIIVIKRELKNIMKDFQVEKIGLWELRDTQRKQVGTLIAAEQTRWKRRKLA